MKRPGSVWPLALGGLLAASVVFNLAVVFVASRDPSFAVERNYYRKALAWDQVMAQEHRNAELGWRLDLALDRAPSAAHATLVARLADRDGRPIDNARVVVEALHNARANDVIQATLAADGTGRYVGALPMHRAGLWELRLRVEHGGDVFTEVVTRDLAAKAAPTS